MRGSNSLQKTCDRFGRQDKMGTQTPKAAGKSASPFSSTHRYPTRSSSTMDMDSSRDASTSTWPQHRRCTEGPLAEEETCMERGMRAKLSDEPAARDAYPPPPTPPNHLNIPEELAQIIITMISEDKQKEGFTGEDLAEAFREAPDSPPITKQSLSELDIQSIITNIKLRHDVNFDQDLSFRPNLDGSKGQGKLRATGQYWKALVAELRLYERLFQGTPLPQGLTQTNWEAITHHVERRLPTMFQTIRDVLKSLVPDRDHPIVEELLDVSMLMQEVERGVCDLVRLAECIAHLLKEHCAPMRDVWVDAMVRGIRMGASKHTPDRSEMIVLGLKELLGILEAMKLDVANHQIRNLKTLLIEDTVNFEKHYHLDRLVSFRSKVNINIAQSWYADATDEFGLQCTPRQRDASGFQLEIFTRAVVAVLFGRNGCGEFPDTFYLDHDRLHILKAEIDDLVFFDICMEMFAELAKRFGYNGPISLTVRQRLRAAILAILGEAAGQGSLQWMMNSEALSLEILRQASRLADRPPKHHFGHLVEANQHLRLLFNERSTHHAVRLEASFLSQILTSTIHHSTSSPMDLFNNLVSISPSTPALPTHFSQPLTSDTFASTQMPPETAKLIDLTNRISHIIVLHWRVWSRIAYVPVDDSPQSLILYPDESTSVSPSQPSARSNRSPATVSEEVPHLVTAMKTGEGRDSGQEAHVARQTQSQ
ncbi:T-complex protein 11-domain-containing protein [Pyrenochaeta sp. MPI-SDFR-AT-0127]|nr:T-complex protein 11-domain-containing protein [Pyrenochaeta sp. MPI-SDFR-AT-0127]